MRKSRSLAVLALALFVDSLGFGLVIPLLPFFATSLGANEIQYGLLISVFAFCHFLFAPIWGRLSDQYGRRPIILIGVLGSSVSFILFGLSNTLGFLFVTRIITGFFTAATLSTANAYIADSTTKEERSKYYGILGAANGLGFTLGPAIGGLLFKFSIFGITGFMLPAFFASFLSIINFIAAWFMLPETDRKLQFADSKFRVISISNFQRVLNNSDLRIFVIFIALNGLAFSTFIATFALFAPVIDPRIDELTLGLIYSVAGIGQVLVQGFLMGPISRRMDEISAIRVGSIISTIGFMLVVFYTASLPLFIVFLSPLPVIFGLAILIPSVNSAISKRAAAEDQGMASGVAQSGNALMRVIGPIIGGLLLSWNLRSPFVFSSIVFLSIFIISSTSIHKRDQ
ncbi:MAG: MFS transporter [Candidatus Heimdallarchaeota archaeon]|nr:MFS transporter [Candidatus Heimdallarchaeota archaeon]